MKLPEIGRNDLCPCMSGKKYKKCCMEKDVREERDALASASNAVANDADEVPGRTSTASKALQRANWWRQPKAKKW